MVIYLEGSVCWSSNSIERIVACGVWAASASMLWQWVRRLRHASVAGHIGFPVNCGFFLFLFFAFVWSVRVLFLCVHWFFEWVLVVSVNFCVCAVPVFGLEFSGASGVLCSLVRWYIVIQAIYLAFMIHFCTLNEKCLWTLILSRIRWRRGARSAVPGSTCRGLKTSPSLSTRPIATAAGSRTASGRWGVEAVTDNSFSGGRVGCGDAFSAGTFVGALRHQEHGCSSENDPDFDWVWLVVEAVFQLFDQSIQIICGRVVRS